MKLTKNTKLKHVDLAWIFNERYRIFKSYMGEGVSFYRNCGAASVGEHDGVI